MEIGLNLLWLGVVLVFASIWIFRWRPASPAGTISAAAALGCALILLFPSVSLTDDLNPQIVAVDAAIGKRSSCQLLSGAGCKLSHVKILAGKLPAHSAPAVLSTFPALAILAVSGTTTEHASAHSPAERNSLAGRSPPPLNVC